jgi:hypothetical protein
MMSRLALMAVGDTSTQPIMLAVTGRLPSLAYTATRKSPDGCSSPLPQPISLHME